MEPAFGTIIRIGEGYVLPRCLHAVAELGIADILGDLPMPISDLAQLSRTEPGALRRVLRLLAAHGVFQLALDKCSHSSASELLRTDHPQSMRAFVRMVGLPICWNSFGELKHSIESGMPSADRAAKGGWWGYFRDSPEASKIFDEAMRARAQAETHSVLQCYDFSRFASIADIGGGQGHLLEAILRVNPGASGVLFDQPHVIEQAANGLSERLRPQAGDFFRDTLPTCDAYVLMEVIHDWNDDESVQIMKAVRNAAPPHAKLILIENALPDDSVPHRGQIVDIFMLALLPGRQRTTGEYTELFSKAGFSLNKEIHATPDLSILEASLL